MDRLYKILPFIVFIIALAGCKKENLTELNKGDTALAIATSANTIVLKEKDKNTDIVTLSWTTGSNHNTDAAILYTLQMAKQGTNFASPVSENIGKGIYSRKFTVAELNDSIRHYFTAVPGTELSIEARVIAQTQAASITAETSTPVVIKITPYQPVSSTLYLYGTASPNGADAGKATPMAASLTEAGSFTWTGQLKTGSFTFIASQGQLLPSYNKGATETTLLYRTTVTQPDDVFTITTNRVYAVTVNLIDLTISIVQSSEPPYARLWVVGDATPNGWNIDNPGEMQVDSTNMFVFNYNEVLKAGEFKIPVKTGDFGADFYMPLTNHPAISATGVQLVSGGNPDNKWQVTAPGPYKIKLDLLNMKIDIKQFTPYTSLWLVGDATPAGWSIDNPTPMVPTAGNPYEFTWTGAMTAGEFKIPTATGNWSGGFYMPVTNHQSNSNRLAKFITGGVTDDKWQITVPGNYKITFNQLKETIDIVKL